MAVQMLALVLNAAAEQAVRLELERCTLEIEGANTHSKRALDVDVDSGKGKTAFLIVVRPLRFEDLGIDEYVELALFLSGADIDDTDPLRPLDLVRGEADTRGGVHRLDHIGDQLPHRIVHLRD